MAKVLVAHLPARATNTASASLGVLWVLWALGPSGSDVLELLLLDGKETRKCEHEERQCENHQARVPCEGEGPT